MATKIYTRTGDEGTSQLLSVGRVPKDHLRLTVYGDLDELNSLVGMALAQGVSEPLDTQLPAVQQQLFVLSSQIAVPNPDRIGFPIPALTPADTERLEQWIDAADAGLPPLQQFILPGGGPGGSVLHLARTVCRRCERHLHTLHREEPVPEPARIYINRLSDYLFVAARYDNHRRGLTETPFTPPTADAD